MKKTILICLVLALGTACTINGVPIFRVSVPTVTVDPAIEIGVDADEVMPADVAVQYDDPVRGWYIDGYWGPGHVWVAPFWTTDVYVLHDHFAYYHGGHRNFFERDYFHREGFRGGLTRHQERVRARQAGRAERRDERR